ncbi:MAG: site-2 protease family protein [Actinomycetota bacterium]|nr:site-2 protease family protein [Actinomycetota bacterium]
MSSAFGIFIFIVAILLVVMIHEAGHLLMAKLFNFKAPQFFVGFGPTLWSFKRGETEYGIKAIPAGGFVKIVGMNPYETVPPEDQPRAYGNKPRWQRALVLVAGSATHFLVAFIVLLVTAMTIGFPTGGLSNKIAAVQAETPAAQADLRAGDTILAVDGVETDTWGDVRRFIQDHANEEVTFVVDRGGETVELDAQVGEAIFNSQGEVVVQPRPGKELREPRAGEEVNGFLGLLPDAEYETYSLPGAVGQSGSLVWQISRDSITKGIPRIFTPIFNGELFDALRGGERTAEDPIGVVGAGRLAGQSVESGRYLDLIMLIVFFTIFVGILNLLPLPPLDGGHLAVVAYEAVTGRTVDIRKLIPVAAAVISFFVLLFFAVLYLDIARPVEVPF